MRGRGKSTKILYNGATQQFSDHCRPNRIIDPTIAYPNLESVSRMTAFLLSFA